MQTFVPFADFAQSAAVLDRARLGKQRLETLQILNVLVGDNPKAGWRNHPAVRMWRGHEPALCAYGLAMCDEWLRRGYRDTIRAKIEAHAAALDGRSAEPPLWLGDEAVHSSHRGRLLRKAEKVVAEGVWYAQFGWTDPPSDDYVWPVPLLSGGAK